MPAYRERVAERLGHYPFQLSRCIWVHAVSVGETLAAVPLIKSLQLSHPHLPVLVTTMTPTGSALVKQSLGEHVHHVYLPYDVPCAVSRFLASFRPLIGIIMETELWPNLFAQCQKQNVPICLINARLSEKSANGYRLVAALVREMLHHVAVVAATGAEDAKRLIGLGAQKARVVVTGNVKFDLQLPDGLAERSDAWREKAGKDRFIWIAASTHDKEEAIVLDAHRKLRQKDPNALLILAPRHPERCHSIYSLCETFFVTERMGQSASCGKETGVYLVDRIGALLMMYCVADVAFVGGSLVPHGGHNMLEPAALSKPILSGPYCHNFTDSVKQLLSRDALSLVHHAEELATQLLLLRASPTLCAQMGLRARQVVEANRGALAKQTGLINGLLVNR